MSLAGYAISVALHASALSIAGVAVVALIRRPQARAATILILLIVLSIAPWVLPVLRNRVPAEVAKPSLTVTKKPVQTALALVRLPEWTIASLPAESDAVLLSADVTGGAPAGQRASGVAPFSAARLSSAVVGLWLAVSAGGVVWLLASGLRLGFWLRGLPGLSDEQWSLVSRHLDGVEIPRSVFRLSSDGRGPCVGGIFRPRVVLPLSLIGEGALAQQLRWTLAHESCHWKHGDSRRVWLVALARSLYWWNPVVHLLARCWTAAREQVCDLQAGESERTGYSSFLVKMAGGASRSGGGLAVSMVRRQRSRSLRRRIVALLNASPADQLPAGRGFKLATAGGLGALAVVLSGMTIAEDARRTSTVLEEKGPQNKEDELLWETPPPGEVARVRPELPLGPHRLAKLKFAVVYSTHDIIGERQVIPASEYESFRNKIYSDPSNVVAELPAMTTRDGEHGRMEFIREVIKPNAREGAPRILGWRLNTAAHCENDRVEVTVKASYGFVPGHAFGTSNPQKIRWPEATDSIMEASTESAAAVGPGDILVTSLKKVDEGCYATVLTMAVMVDATGHAMNSSSPAGEDYSKEKLLLRGTISTFPLTEAQKSYLAKVKEIRRTAKSGAPSLPDPPNGQYEDPAFGVSYFSSERPRVAAVFSPAQWKPLQGATGPEETLETLEIPCGTVLRPWKQLDLTLEAGLSPGIRQDQPILTLRDEKGATMQSANLGETWVIELKATQPGTRRLLVMTPGKAE